ncbi:MAG: Glu/Leu/Phe/Val dehydrogenase [Patescibacteria group bacterium]|jgi:glutamate dehydrogenase (NAD(P)+)
MAKINPYKSALAQLDKAAKLMNLDPEVHERLKRPKREIHISIPVCMDNGSLKVFEGYRVQYDNTRGPFKGGIRFHPQTEINEVKALSFWMTFKCAAVGIPMGGSKGGVTVNHRELSEGELERLSRGFIQALAKDIGPTIDIPAPDVYTNPKIMAWMMDEYCKIKGEYLPGVITGKPVEIGGSQGRGYATAQGGAYIVFELAKKMGLKKGAKVVIQGFGNAGSYMVSILAKAGYNIIAVSDSKGGIFSDKGLDPKKVLAHKKKTGSVMDFEGSKNITNKQIFSIPCDILIPAALENVLTKENAGKVKAKAIVELANGPTTPEADEKFNKKGILLVPDILSNAGGVTVSYFEGVQNAYNYYWTEEEVLAKLKPIMVNNFNEIWQAHEKYNTDIRTAAYIVAAGRIAAAQKARRF